MLIERKKQNTYCYHKNTTCHHSKKENQPSEYKNHIEYRRRIKENISITKIIAKNERRNNDDNKQQRIQINHLPLKHRIPYINYTN